MFENEREQKTGKSVNFEEYAEMDTFGERERKERVVLRELYSGQNRIG